MAVAISKLKEISPTKKTIKPLFIKCFNERFNPIAAIEKSNA